MREFLFAHLLCLIGTSVKMSTGTFVLRFPELTNANKMTVICNGTKKIAQYCETDQSCPNKTNTGGVSLEMDGCPTLTITNRTYDSGSCEARGYIDDNERTVHFTVVFLSNQEHTSTPPSPGTTGTSPSPESHSGAIAAGVSVSICLVLMMMMMIIYILYWKVEHFRQAICDIYSNLQRNNSTGQKSTSNKDIEAGEKLQPGSV